MANELACLFDNLADAGTIAASSTDAGVYAYPENLLHPHRHKVWRSGAVTSATLDVVLATAAGIEAVVIGDHNVPVNGTLRVQGFTAGFGTGQVYDSGAGAPSVWGPRPSHLVVLPAPVTARYWRVTLSAPGASYLQAGRLYLGPAWRPAVNVEVGWDGLVEDLAVVGRTRGGQRYAAAVASPGRQRWVLPRLTEAERETLLAYRHALGTTKPWWACVSPVGGSEQTQTLLYCTWFGSLRARQRTDSVHQMEVEVAEYL